jgi:hypothetical protein
MGKPRQRAVDILGLQHQSRRCGSRASGCTSKETIANGGRAVRFHANLNHGGNQRSHGHRVRRNWVSRPPHRSAPARSRIPVRIASRHPDRGHRLFGPDDPQLQSVGAGIHDERSVADALASAYGGLLPIPKDTATHVRFARCQFAEAPTSRQWRRLSISRSIDQIGITRLVRWSDAHNIV